VDREYIPAMEEEEKEKLASKWHKAVKMCAGWAKD
jgi:glycerol kinase